ncbi:MAG: DUF4191 family protein [Micromonosporaceae bacterium]|nr:DUF4191 family protein [Micromonosporaceae bacterium]
MAEQPSKPSFLDRLKQIRTAFSYTAKRDKLFVPLAGLAAAIPLGLTVLWVLLGGEWLWAPAGVLLALLGVMVVLNLRVNTAMMNEAEGQPGAAAAILQTMRGDWRVTPAVQVTTQQDFVHRVIGRPGVVLVGEGATGRLRGLLGQEKKRLSRVVGETPIYDYIVGTEEGQLSIRKLRSTLTKLPRNITKGQVSALDTRLKALSAGRPQMPKGPIPKNLRPKGMNRALRGR